VKKAPKGQPLRLLFQDEARFGRISDRRRCWARWPSRPVVASQVVREFLYASTAGCPWDGQLSSLVLPWVDTDTMSRFLLHTGQRFAGDYCIMFLDGAGWHTAHDLRPPPNIQLEFLPGAQNSIPRKPSGNAYAKIISAIRSLTRSTKSKTLSVPVFMLYTTI